MTAKELSLRSQFLKNVAIEIITQRVNKTLKRKIDFEELQFQTCIAGDHMDILGVGKNGDDLYITYYDYNDGNETSKTIQSEDFPLEDLIQIVEVLESIN